MASKNSSTAVSILSSCTYPSINSPPVLSRYSKNSLVSKYYILPSISSLFRSDLKERGAQLIGKYMKGIEELYIGSTGMEKEGFLHICKNCVKLKKLSVVANQITT